MRQQSPVICTLISYTGVWSERRGWINTARSDLYLGDSPKVNLDGENSSGLGGNSANVVSVKLETGRGIFLARKAIWMLYFSQFGRPETRQAVDGMLEAPRRSGAAANVPEHVHSFSLPLSHDHPLDDNRGNPDVTPLECNKNNLRTISPEVFQVEPLELERRWSTERAWAWYASRPYMAGANFVPSTAINQLEMWQAATFDPATIDRELGWAASIGLNTMRVFLHDLLWQDDAAAFMLRIDEYLEIADRHGIKTILVLFDSVWDPQPVLGAQRAPRPGVHNSGWVQGPHIELLKDESRHEELKPYVAGIVERYKHDPRVLMWDLYNEPDNRVPYTEFEPSNKAELCASLLRKVHAWVREVNPEQPLTVCVWKDVENTAKASLPLDDLSLAVSDVISFHSYAPLKSVQRVVQWLRPHGRPIICTEYMARSGGSTFQEIFPYLLEENIGAIHWGLVSGRSQTIYPWSTWTEPLRAAPEVWFHDLFHPDGTPYCPHEVEVIQSLMGRRVLEAAGQT